MTIADSADVVYDAGVLIAADRNDRTTWADHRARLEAGLTPMTTAPVVAQVSRSARQVQLRRFLRGCQTAPFAPGDAHEVGALLARARRGDVVDAHLLLVACSAEAPVLTADCADVSWLASHVPAPVRILSV